MPEAVGGALPAGLYADRQPPSSELPSAVGSPWCYFAGGEGQVSPGHQEASQVSEHGQAAQDGAAPSSRAARVLPPRAARVLPPSAWTAEGQRPGSRGLRSKPSLCRSPRPAQCLALCPPGGLPGHLPCGLGGSAQPWRGRFPRVARLALAFTLLLPDSVIRPGTQLTLHQPCDRATGLAL